jgi:hypothetical protein
MRKQVTLTLCDGCIVDQEISQEDLDKLNRPFETLETGFCAYCGSKIRIQKGDIIICEACYYQSNWYLCQYCGKAMNDELDEPCCTRCRELVEKEEE